jgi:hypothetical protein
MDKEGTCRCGARWTGLSRAHCAACHDTFTTVTNFDRHRRNGRCVDPASVGLIFKNGLWRQPTPMGWPFDGSGVALVS